MYKIDKDIPVPKSVSKYADLLVMEIGDSVEFTDKEEFLAAGSFLRRHFKIKSMKYEDYLQEKKPTDTTDIDTNKHGMYRIFSGRILRVE